MTFDLQMDVNVWLLLDDILECVGNSRMELVHVVCSMCLLTSKV